MDWFGSISGIVVGVGVCGLLLGIETIREGRRARRRAVALNKFYREMDQKTLLQEIALRAFLADLYPKAEE